MNVQFPVLILLLAGHAVAGQQPVQSPSQDETLAKWPWSISLQTAPFKREAIQITLAPKEGMEYKYRLEKGAGMLYSWASTGVIHWELHSQPDGAPSGYAEFFDTNDGTALTASTARRSRASTAGGGKTRAIVRSRFR